MIRYKERKYEEMRDLLEDLSTQLEEIREEFLSAIEDLEDKIAGGCKKFCVFGSPCFPG